jgi:L-lactate dehydrogenase complex protein LldF
MTTLIPIEALSLRQRTAVAVDEPRLRTSIERATDALHDRQQTAYGQFADPEQLRAAARAAKAQVLSRLPDVLEQLADRLEAAGVIVHWAATDREACDIVTGIATERNVRRVVKSKSMLTEEIGLNHALEDIGIEVTETDLGEWIIQLAGEAPSHIIVPAIHQDRTQCRDTLQTICAHPLGDDPKDLAAFARETLRSRFLAADMGISGVNFAIAESGSLILVTNEGNGRLTTSVPPVHVAMLGMERVLESWDQLDLFLALLTRAATGQPITTYVSAITGPPRADEGEGPKEVHVVIVDNGRSDILGTEFSEMLACVRCGACLNVCPVYRVTGGHAYGWVYPGPMGAVLTPLLLESEAAGEVANASSLCGACWEACPVGIPLQDMLLALRRRHAGKASLAERAAWKTWAAAWSRPSTYRASLRAGTIGGKLDPSSWPGITRRWSQGRAVPDLPKRSFRQQWKDSSQ